MIGIVDYRAGNLTSVARALEYLNEPCIVTSDAGILDSASHDFRRRGRRFSLGVRGCH